MKEYDIALLGPSRVGKTSLLATMYDQLSNSPNGIWLQPDEDTSKALASTQGELRQAADQPLYISVPPLITGTRELLRRQFKVMRKDRAVFRFNFWDVKGGVVQAGSQDPVGKEFIEVLQRSHVIINVLDGAALMECSRLESDELNACFRVRDMLAKALADEQEHCVIFVITKCEKWLHKNKSVQLRERFDAYHKSVLAQVQKNRVTVSAVIPVETLGCLEFHRLIRDKKKSEQQNNDCDDLKFEFIRVPKREYEPRYVDQPLRCAILFLINHVYSKHRSIWKKIKHLFGDFWEDVTTFAKGFDEHYLIKSPSLNQPKSEE